jgi:hypothetical protein
MRKLVLALLGIVLLLPVVFAFSQRMIQNSAFEWGTHKKISGILELSPYPHLLVPRLGAMSELSRYSIYYLVAQGKFSLPQDALATFDGKPVTVRGTLIYRENQTMIETKPDWIQAAGRITLTDQFPRSLSLGRQKFVGEIVDSKCFLGVMNPGQLAPHRACAIRCISGGVPPILFVKQKNGPPICLLLVSADGKPVNKQVLDLVAEPVEITGEVEQQGELLILRADPATYRKL